MQWLSKFIQNLFQNVKKMNPTPKTDREKKKKKEYNDKLPLTKGTYQKII